MQGKELRRERMEGRQLWKGWIKLNSGGIHAGSTEEKVTVLKGWGSPGEAQTQQKRTASGVRAA